MVHSYQPKARLYVPHPLAEQTNVTLDADQSHYVARVMRGAVGDVLHLFNGTDGEWAAEIKDANKKSVTLFCTNQTRKQHHCPDIWLCFAPIKAGRIDFLAEKATELGVSALLPVKTDRTIVSRVNEERLKANVIEAAEQTERLDLPEIRPYQPLQSLLDNWPEDRSLYYGDELGSGIDASTLWKELDYGKCALLIGPEGGFSEKEQQMLRQHPQAKPVSLGPRILRADTAALAGLTCLQLAVGDWNSVPRAQN